MTALVIATVIGIATGLTAYGISAARAHRRSVVEELGPFPSRRPIALEQQVRRMSGRVFGRITARRRLARFNDELPDALELCAGSLEAGASLAQALEVVAADGRPPLSSELARALAESHLGEPLPDALERAAARCGSREFAWVVRGVRAQHEYGASLSTLLRTAAATIRARAELHREVRALTAEGRISARILIAMPFVVAGFFMMANPSYLTSLTSTPAGVALLGVASVLMTGGIIWMRRIVRVEV